ncbi:hypothetical protein RJT34_13654 [Clitoria ternatea]|uniref:Uncharacterized protein n=1 Tax=Clitoria ternatea TaxID=43366 RepID=A0AAN9JRI5_CLITE
MTWEEREKRIHSHIPTISLPPSVTNIGTFLSPAIPVTQHAIIINKVSSPNLSSSAATNNHDTTLSLSLSCLIITLHTNQRLIKI